MNCLSREHSCPSLRQVVSNSAMFGNLSAYQHYGSMCQDYSQVFSLFDSSISAIIFKTQFLRIVFFCEQIIKSSVNCQEPSVNETYKGYFFVVESMDYPMMKTLFDV